MEHIKKKRRKKRRSSHVLLYLLLALTAAALLVTLSLTVFFPITKIEVSGNEKYDKKIVAEFCGVDKGDNLFTVDTKAVENNLTTELPYIQSVKIDRALLGTLKITVSETGVKAQLQSGKRLIYTDENMKVLEISKKLIKGAPVIRGLTVSKSDEGFRAEIKEAENEDRFLLLAKITQALAAAELNNITVVNIKDEQDIRVTYNDKIVLFFGSETYLDKKIAHAKATIKQRSESAETGTLNLSMISETNSSASFIPTQLTSEQVAAIKN